MAYRKLAVSISSAFGAGFGLSWYMFGNNSYDKKDPIVEIDSPIFSNLIDKMKLNAKVIANENTAVVPIQPESKHPTRLNSPTQISELMKHGYPSYDGLRIFEDYALSYDRRNRVPNWVFERLTRSSVTKGDGVKRSEFKEDTLIHPFFRSRDQDYRRSGYDR